MKDMDPIDGVNWAPSSAPGWRVAAEAHWLLADDLLFVSRGTRFYAACLDAPPGPAVCGPHLFHLRVKPASQLLPAFLAWQINQPPFQRALLRAAEGSSQLQRAASGAGGACPSASRRCADQQRIVELARLARRERQLHRQLIRNRERIFESIAESLTGPTVAITRHQGTS